ncbi:MULTISPECIES: FAD binding domain-containing protein [Pseudonocardia]|uniref:4-hydroxybenzoyl-CoA reductase subunit beta n=2 Tax=Pseudonocardia TaxID=1847 RepID=A0A1Y2MIZ5_PSEAH|nr:MULTISPECIES: xanthine dehydrogenase family protein subunit M [Pseudonocardia]OSY35246.1 4-hydroxybenzoyl-CoA reductase subunit beta [Pseudonocardia autotrophica]TDN73153.1 xanthine dehydrogenase YagS FAD-binding subunit [Pseudonocardia autotrophica]BBG03875.1 oxidoreductase [Pseudonocardia autotrophica]GEC29532.1 oxidoreductase [Pseudonocardia saturnea]
MRTFDYARPSTAGEASALVGSSGGTGCFIAGGTNLVDLMKNGVTAPELLVDVRDVTSQDVVSRSDGALTIGAATTNAALAAHPAVRRHHPVLAEAVLAGASGQIRNVATVGGNLLQRTRCGYFADITKPCNKREPGSGCPAVAGHHRDLAVIGTSDHCVASNPGDMAVALAALDATVHVRSATGPTRTLTLDELYRLPGDEPQHDVTLAAGDLITAVDVPPPPPGRMRYRKVRDRASYAFALVSVAAVLEVRDGLITGVRLAFGGIAPRPWRARRAESELLGRTPAAEVIDAAVRAEFAGARPLAGNAFKIDLAVSTAIGVLGDLARDTGGDNRNGEEER